MVWACGCITLTIGYVNVLSIAFASILFGLGIDYGIYYVARYLQVRREHGLDQRGAGARRPARGAGHSDRGAHLGHRLLRGRA